MSPAATTTPPGTIAAILEAVVRMRHAYELPNIAVNYHLTLEELQTLLAGYGYPDKAAMARHRGELLRHAEHGTDDTEAAVTVTETPETGTDPAPTVTAPAEDAATPAGGQLANVKVTRLHPDPDNPRDHLTDIEDLADSIKEVGLLQPIVARTDGTRLIVVAGHRRLAAVKHLRWDTVDVIIRPSMRPDHVLAAMLIENNQRADLDPIEEARGLNRLKIQLDLSEKDLAAKVGRSLGYVNGRLLLLQLPVEEQEQVRAGQLGVTTATHKARVGAGRTRPGAVGRPAIGHLSATHALATAAGNRCTTAGHARGKGKGVGGVACGVCWEAVIRADERQHLHDHSARTGSCALCGALHDPDNTTGAAQ